MAETDWLKNNRATMLIAVKEKFNSFPNSTRFNTKAIQYFRRNIFFLAYNSEQKMFCTNIAVRNR